MVSSMAASGPLLQGRKQQLPVSSVECCQDPRGQLLWSIVGKATSSNWQSANQPVPQGQGRQVKGTGDTAEGTASPCRSQAGSPDSQVAAEVVGSAAAECQGPRELALVSAEQPLWMQLPSELVPLIALAADTPAVAAVLASVCRCEVCCYHGVAACIKLLC